jgi:hypothetical protein
LEDSRENVHESLATPKTISEVSLVSNWPVTGTAAEIVSETKLSIAVTPTDDENLALARERINQYKRAAIAAKRSGDLVLAKENLKISKVLGDAVERADRAGTGRWADAGVTSVPGPPPIASEISVLTQRTAPSSTMSVRDMEAPKVIHAQSSVQPRLQSSVSVTKSSSSVQQKTLSMNNSPATKSPTGTTPSNSGPSSSSRSSAFSSQQHPLSAAALLPQPKAFDSPEDVHQYVLDTLRAQTTLAANSAAYHLRMGQKDLALSNCLFRVSFANKCVCLCISFSL